MATITKNIGQQQINKNFVSTSYVAPKGPSISLIQRYEDYIDSIKFSHYGIMVMAVLIGSCFGSIAAMFVFMSGAPIWVFAIGLFASMANLVACISQAPTKWVVGLFALSVVINTLLVVISIL